jgi:hypothetical protein
MVHNLIRPALGALGISGVLAGGAVAQEAGGPPLTLGGVFLDAAAPIKLLMLVLIAVGIAALVLLVLKLATSANAHPDATRLSRGLGFLAATGKAAPLAGLAGSLYVLLLGALGVANSPVPVTASVLAPGIAEALLLVLIGVLAAVPAVIAHWLVRTRMARMVAA